MTNTAMETRKIIANWAMKGATIQNCGRMCKTCAFKLDSDANLEPHNVRAALECLAGDNMTFNCHIVAGVDAGCECIGFKHAKIYLQNQDDE